MTWDRTHIATKVLARDLMVSVLLGVIFAFLGVYDTNALALSHRVVFWTTVMCLGALLLFVIEPLVFRRLCRNFHPAAQIFITAALISIPITVFLVGLNTNFSFVYPVKFWGLQFVGVIIISVIMSAGRYLIFQFFGRAEKDSGVVEKPQDAIELFLERLPIKFRSAVLFAVSSEGHYLRVHTDRGSHLILMRISDAVRQLTYARGLQVHRSWWVAYDGIADTKRVNGRRMLILKNGEIAPVSRSHIPALKAVNIFV